MPHSRPTMPPTAFGLWLKTQRETLGLSQHQLAVQLGTTANTIGRWETGARACALEGAVRLALEALHTRHAAQRIEITEPIVPPEPPEVPDAGTQPTDGSLPPGLPRR